MLFTSFQFFLRRPRPVRSEFPVVEMVVSDFYRVRTDTGKMFNLDGDFGLRGENKVNVPRLQYKPISP